MLIIFKTSAETMPEVLLFAKHAVRGLPKRAQEGDIILVAQTVLSLEPGQKSIRSIMEYVRSYEDNTGESQRIWGRSWKYIVEARNVRAIDPFNIRDLQVTNKDYDSAVNFVYVEPEDEIEILRHIGETRFTAFDEREDLIDDLPDLPGIGIRQALSELDRKYSGTPRYQEVLIRRLNRPSSLRSAILEEYGTSCRICGAEGFRKKNGGRYAEVHHMVELSRQAPNSLQSWNALVVCPTCHRKLHFADVETEFLNPGWRIVIDGVEHLVMGEPQK